MSFTELSYGKWCVVVLNVWTKLAMTIDCKLVMHVCTRFVILLMLVTLFVVSNITMLHMLFECHHLEQQKLLMFNDDYYTKKGLSVKTLVDQVINNKNMNLNSFCVLAMSKK